MPTMQDLDYYVRRERQERALADRAQQDVGRHVHLEMARRYARMIADAKSHGRQPPPTVATSVPR